MSPGYTVCFFFAKGLLLWDLEACVFSPNSDVQNPQLLGIMLIWLSIPRTMSINSNKQLKECFKDHLSWRRDQESEEEAMAEDGMTSERADGLWGFP